MKTTKKTTKRVKTEKAIYWTWDGCFRYICYEDKLVYEANIRTLVVSSKEKNKWLYLRKTRNGIIKVINKQWLSLSVGQKNKYNCETTRYTIYFIKMQQTIWDDVGNTRIMFI